MTQLTRRTNDLMSMPSLLTDLLDVDRFFGNQPLFRGERNKMPAVNIKEKDNHYEIDIAAPGMKKEEFKVEMDNNILTISAEHKQEKKEEKENYTRREFSYETFSRSFELPATINDNAIEAHYQDGILKLTLPKKQEAMNNKRKAINIA